MPFSESLTVRILGDSSALRQELEAVISQFDLLEEQISSVSSSGRGLANAFNQLSSATRPIQQLSTQLARLAQQMRSISTQPVSINVQPAMQALAQLMAMIARVAAALRSLSAFGPTAGPSPLPPTGPGPSPGPRHLATGGFVTGPPGIDRVPAQLTAGEFVLNQTAVSTLGLSLVERLNRAPGSIPPGRLESGTNSPIPSERTHSPLIEAGARTQLNLFVATTPNGTQPTNTTPRTRLGQAPFSTTGTIDSREPPPLTSSTVNQFGGIEINVRESADVSELFDDLRKQGISARHRRG